MLSSTLLRTQTDARLLALARGGHERAFEAIVERHRSAIGRDCRRLLRDDRAEDAVQQTFLNAWTALERDADVRELRAWLYRIARNACLDVLAHRGYDVAELSASLQGADGPDVDFERQAVMRETLTAVAALPERQRAALLATAVQGRSVASVAAELEIGEGAARQLVHRARQSLRLAVTAVTPTPFAVWLAQSGADGGMLRRITELAATGGGGAAGAVAVKAGAAVVAAGALAGAGGEAVRHHVVTPAKAPAKALTADVRVAAASPSSSAPARGPVHTARAVAPVKVRAVVAQTRPSMTVALAHAPKVHATAPRRQTTTRTSDEDVPTLVPTREDTAADDRGRPTGRPQGAVTRPVSDESSAVTARPVVFGTEGLRPHASVARRAPRSGLAAPQGPARPGGARGSFPFGAAVGPGHSPAPTQAS